MSLRAVGIFAGCWSHTAECTGPRIQVALQACWVACLLVVLCRCVKPSHSFTNALFNRPARRIGLSLLVQTQARPHVPAAIEAQGGTLVNCTQPSHAAHHCGPGSVEVAGSDFGRACSTVASRTCSSLDMDKAPDQEFADHGAALAQSAAHGNLSAVAGLLDAGALVDCWLGPVSQAAWAMLQLP